MVFVDLIKSINDFIRYLFLFLLCKNKNIPTFQSGGRTISSNTGFLANPSRAAQHAANNAGALTRNEASAIGLQLAGRPSGPFSGPSRSLQGFRR
jgi:hypothetical protein